VTDDETPPPDPDRRPRDRHPAHRDDRDEYDDDEDRPRRRRRRPPPVDDPSLRLIAPVNTSGLAIIAGYLGLISVLCFPAPFALLFGILALNHLKKHPDQDGKGRAIFGIVMGILFSLPLPFVLFGMLTAK
jgi:hypothetical protein